MTNKINGIDVSECRRSIGKNNYCRYFKSPCADNSNCIWKKYKHLQQELDIKEKMLDKFMIGSGEILEKLQKENEELKKYQYTQEYLQSEIEKRQKALEEIRKIISGNYEILDPQAKQDIKKLIDEVLNDRD